MKKYIILAIIVVVVVIFATSKNGDKIYSFDEIYKVEFNSIDSVLLRIDLDNPNNMEISKESLQDIMDILGSKRYKKPEENKIILTEDGIEKNRFICRITTLGENGSSTIYIYNRAISIINDNGKGKIYELMDEINEDEISILKENFDM